jgi:hypothetical protein
MRKYKHNTHTNISSLGWNTIKDLNLAAPIDETLLEQFRERWVLPQIMHVLGTQLRLARDSDNKISISESAKLWKIALESGEIKYSDKKLVSMDDLLGILKFLRIPSRSAILPEGDKQLGNRFSSAVPLFLSAFKEYRSIPYKHWNTCDSKLSSVLDLKSVELFSYLESDVGKNWTTDELIEFREIARVVKTGKRSGELRSINATFAITGIKDEEFNKLPSIVKCLLCQTWVFQPYLHTELSINNLLDPDAPASSLVDIEILPVVEKVKKPQEDLW